MLDGLGIDLPDVKLLSPDWSALIGHNGHLHVHLMEMSPFPQRALRAGDRLRDLVPDAGHLIHMPTHIDVLCGHYRDVVVYNQKAIVADRKFLARQGPMNVYALYRTHNHHFAIYGAMFLGQYTPALQAAEELIATTPDALLRIPSPPMADFIEGYIPMKQHVLVRFGKWQEILDEALPEDRELYCSTTAMMLYAKTVAHSTLGNIAQAEKTRAAFLEAKARVPESRRVHNNTVVDLLAIAEEMLNGELEYRRGNFDTAFAHLRRSVALDDALPYDEPWGWMQPTRHALGALLLEQGRVEEAETVFYDDHALLLDDPEHSGDEDRFVLLGLSSRFRVLVVVHTYREYDAVIRLISARRATKAEQAGYDARWQQ